MSLFINKARFEGKNNWWMYLIGVMFSFIGGQLIGAIPMVILIFRKGKFDLNSISNPESLGIDKNYFLVLLLLPFICSFIILYFYIRFVHKKRFLSLITPFGKFSWSKFFFSFVVWLCMSGIFDLISYLSDPSNYEFHGVNFPSFLILIAISLILIPIQTTYEELLFRSYLMQGIGMLEPYRIIPLLVTSLAFGLIHIANPEINEYGYLVLVQYVSIGFLLGLLTMLSDSTEFSIGLHAANNIYGCLFVSFKSSALTTDSMFYIKNMQVDWKTILLYLLVLVIFFFIIKMKYKLLPIKCLTEEFKVEPLSNEELSSSFTPIS